MDKRFFALAALFLLAALVSSGTASAETGTASIYVSLAKYEPFPAEAGQYTDVWLKAENLGGTTSGSVIVEVLPKYPFSLESDDAKKNLGPVPASGIQLVKYRIKVDEKATSGNNILSIRYQAEGSSSWLTKDITIYVQEHDAVLSVSNVSSEEMVPGNVQQVSMALDNMANSYLKDISIALDFSATTLPFATVDSVNEKRIIGIPAKGSSETTFNIITFPDAVSGVYKVPVTVKYSDATNKTYTRQYSVGFVVNSAPDFSVGLQKYDAITEGAAGSITVSVSNTGPGAIKFMTMDILPSESYEALGEKSIYLGNLNPDDYQTGSFKIYVKEGALAGEKTLPVKLALKYRDGLNNVLSKEATLDLRIYTPDEISAYGLGAAGGASSTIYIILAIAAAYYVYRKFFRKKAKA